MIYKHLHRLPSPDLFFFFLQMRPYYTLFSCWLFSPTLLIGDDFILALRDLSIFLKTCMEFWSQVLSFNCCQSRGPFFYIVLILTFPRLFMLRHPVTSWKRRLPGILQGHNKVPFTSPDLLGGKKGTAGFTLD